MGTNAPQQLQLFEQDFQTTGDTFSVSVVGAQGDADRWRAPAFAAVGGF
jgi:hypothetical protein